MDGIAPDQARVALEAADHARRQVAEEVGLPRWYWWALAAAWLAVAALGQVSPWAGGIATTVCGAAHTTVATQLLSGRRRTGRLQVSAAVAGHRLPLVVIGMLLGLVAATIGLALALDADGAGHAGIWAAVPVAAVVGFGGPETLRVLRRWARA
jgi:hypothetical protein